MWYPLSLWTCFAGYSYTLPIYSISIILPGSIRVCDLCIDVHIRPINLNRPQPRSYPRKGTGRRPLGRCELGETLNLVAKWRSEEIFPWAFSSWIWLYYKQEPITRFWSMSVKGNVGVKRSVKDEGSQAFMMLQTKHESHTCNKGKADQHALEHLQHQFGCAVASRMHAS